MRFTRSEAVTALLVALVSLGCALVGVCGREHFYGWLVTAGLVMCPVMNVCWLAMQREGNRWQLMMLGGAAVVASVGFMLWAQLSVAP